MVLPLLSKYKVLYVIVLMLSISLSMNADVYLVSVGISDYPGQQHDLHLPAGDAKAISTLYQSNNGAHVSLLVNGKAKKADIIKQMNEQFSKAGRDDIVVFFFSGHGSPGVFNVYDGNLSYDDIRKAMAGSKCNNKMIFADACFSGKIRTDEKADTTATDQETEMKKSNVMLFLSSRGNEFSNERPDMKNGYFTTYLGKGLQGAADANRDRTITAKELFEYVHKGVIELSFGAQHPVMWGNFPDDMTIMKWK